MVVSTYTHIHVGPDAVIGANVNCLQDGETFALRIGTAYSPIVTLFLNKQQFTDICRDFDVLYMVEIMGAGPKEVM